MSGKGDADDALRGEDDVVCHGRRKLTRGDYYRALCHIGYGPDEARKLAEKLKPAEVPVAVAQLGAVAMPDTRPKKKPAASPKRNPRVIGAGD
jgi:hypothetical protein